MTDFSMFMSLRDIAPGNSWLRGVSLKDYKIIRKIKMREMKIILGDFNCAMAKFCKDGENKTK